MTRTRDEKTFELTDPQPDDWVCPECGSDRVMIRVLPLQTQAWVDANTNEVQDDTGSYMWCSACDEEGRDGETHRLVLRSEFVKQEDAA